MEGRAYFPYPVVLQYLSRFFLLRAPVTPIAFQTNDVPHAAASPCGLRSLTGTTDTALRKAKHDRCKPHVVCIRDALMLTSIT